MTSDNKFGLFRRMLRALGLSQQSADDVVDFIGDLLAGEGKSNHEPKQSPDFPYHLRDNFLSAAELSFFDVLRTVVGNRAVLCTKVALGDVFWVKRDDASRHRIYTNKIDRKHVDFLVCDPATMRPLLGIELDDKSHQRQDRQERDAFVDQVFNAAGLPLLHIPAKRGYVVADLSTTLAPYLNIQAAHPTPTPQAELASPLETTKAPNCPKCGSSMILRTVRSGANAGNQFWGCSNYPNCRSMIPYTG